MPINSAQKATQHSEQNVWGCGDDTPKADFNLSGGCFGTEIIKNGTKRSNIGVHRLSFGPIEAEFQGASFLIQKNVEKL